MTHTAGTKRSCPAGTLPDAQRPCTDSAGLPASGGGGGPRKRASSGGTGAAATKVASWDRLDDLANVALGLSTGQAEPTRGSNIDPSGVAEPRPSRAATPLPPLPSTALAAVPASPSHAPLSWGGLVCLAERGTLKVSDLPVDLSRPQTQTLALAAAANAAVPCAQILLNQLSGARALPQLTLALAACWGRQPEAAQRLAAGLSICGSDPEAMPLLQMYFSHTLSMARAGNVPALRAAYSLTSLRDACTVRFQVLTGLSKMAIYAGNHGLLALLLEDPEQVVGAPGSPSLGSIGARHQMLDLLQSAAQEDQPVAFVQIMNSRAVAGAEARSLFDEAIGQHITVALTAGAPTGPKPGFLRLLSWEHARRQHWPLVESRYRAATNALWEACRGLHAPTGSADLLNAMKNYTEAWREDNRAQAGKLTDGWERADLPRYTRTLSVALATAVDCRQEGTVRLLLSLVADDGLPELEEILAQARKRALTGGMVTLAEQIAQAAGR